MLQLTFAVIRQLTYVICTKVNRYLVTHPANPILTDTRKNCQRIHTRNVILGELYCPAFYVSRHHCAVMMLTQLAHSSLHHHCHTGMTIIFFFRLIHSYSFLEAGRQPRGKNERLLAGACIISRLKKTSSLRLQSKRLPPERQQTVNNGNTK